MLHAKIIDASIEKIDILKAEEFLSSSNFGALIYFVGTVRDLMKIKKWLESRMTREILWLSKALKKFIKIQR